MLTVKENISQKHMSCPFDNLSIKDLEWDHQHHKDNMITYPSNTETSLLPTDIEPHNETQRPVFIKRSYDSIVYMKRSLPQFNIYSILINTCNKQILCVPENAGLKNN